MNREGIVSVFARARRIIAAGALAAALAATVPAAAGEADRVAQMSSAQAREFTIDQIRALVAIARAGGQHADAQCRAAAARAAHLAGNGIDAVVHADKARERELRAAGTQAAEDPALQDNYRRVANAALEARQTVASSIASCPELIALKR